MTFTYFIIFVIIGAILVVNCLTGVVL
jgi:hypothetical protein